MEEVAALEPLIAPPVAEMFSLLQGRRQPVIRLGASFADLVWSPIPSASCGPSIDIQAGCPFVHMDGLLTRGTSASLAILPVLQSTDEQQALLAAGSQHPYFCCKHGSHVALVILAPAVSKLQVFEAYAAAWQLLHPLEKGSAVGSEPMPSYS